MLNPRMLNRRNPVTPIPRNKNTGTQWYTSPKPLCHKPEQWLGTDSSHSCLDSSHRREFLATVAVRFGCTVCSMETINAEITVCHMTHLYTDGNKRADNVPTTGCPIFARLDLQLL